MASCWSSVLSVLGGGHEDTDEEKQLRGRLLAGKKSVASEALAVKKLEEEVKALERALAAAETERDAAEARRREAEARAEKAVVELRVAEKQRDGRVDELLRKTEEAVAMDERIRELEELIKATTGMTDAPSEDQRKWKFFF